MLSFGETSFNEKYVHLMQNQLQKYLPTITDHKLLAIQHRGICRFIKIMLIQSNKIRD